MKAEIRPGSDLAGYRVVSLLGRGGMSTVFVAEDLRLGRSVALKVMSTDLAENPEFRERFVRESRLAASLEHPSIVPVYSAGEQDGFLYIAMRYVDGTDLRKLIREQGRLGLEQTHEILRHIADALDAAHEAGLVHRDVKPGNILLADKRGILQAYLADFGLTKQAVSTTTSFTSSGQFLGTLDYAAPEQIQGASLDGRADQYALGCVAYQCLTGSVPFPREYEMATLWAHVQDPPPRVTERRPDLSPTLDAVIARAMAKDPNDRFATTQEFVAELVTARGVRSSLSRARRDAGRDHTNLPTPASSFLGREKELGEAEDLLRGTRLLTVTGAGGAGKTRFAIEIASSQINDYPDGVFWVPLAPITDPLLVVESVAQVLEAKDRLEQHIGGKRILLLLDNLEHVIDSAPDLSRLLTSCPNLTLLVTSRELLRIQGETEYALPALTEDEGVRLFCERADAAPSEAIQELCRRLDGLPLAIELAAARRKVLTPEQLVARLGQRLDLLKGGRDADPRHATLRATIQWSSDMLTADERAVFARLSVFAGGCTLEAAQDVCKTGLTDLESLLDKSLVRLDAGRYRMLETIREFALELLAQSMESSQIRRRHAIYYLEMAKEAAPELRGPEQIVWLDQLGRDLDNLRTAIAWSLTEGDLQIGLRLCILLPRFWLQRDLLPEERRWYDAALDRLAEAPPHLRADVLAASGENAIFLDQHVKARDHFERSLVLLRQLGDRVAEARVLQGLGGVAQELGDLESARPFFQEALVICREVGDEAGILRALHLFAECVRDLGELEEARAMLKESLSLSRRIGDQTSIVASTASLGDVELDSHKFDLAAELYGESLRGARTVGSERLAAYGLAGISAVEAVRGENEMAALLWGAVEAIEGELRIHLIGYERARYERLVAAALDLHPERREEGRNLSLDQAIERALASSG